MCILTETSIFSNSKDSIHMKYDDAPKICPVCGNLLKYRDRRQRIIRTEDGRTLQEKITVDTRISWFFNAHPAGFQDEQEGVSCGGSSSGRGQGSWHVVVIPGAGGSVRGHFIGAGWDGELLRGEKSVVSSEYEAWFKDGCAALIADQSMRYSRGIFKKRQKAISWIKFWNLG